MRDIASGVAVIGMACRFPGAPTIEQFWRNLKEGRESITFFSEDEIEPDLRQLARDPSYVRAGAIIDDIDLFDAAFFKISPREATLMDPQHRLFLECAWTALESAGYGDGESRGAVIGCYAGSWASSYTARAAAQVVTPADEFQVLVGGGLDYLTTLASYKLNLTGESVSLQTACSTSLVAVHYAFQSLLDGDIDMALAGGVSIDARQKTGYLYQEGMIFSPDGHCRPFDRRAKGTVRGYGLGLVVLKRLEDAVRDRDHIHAVIRRTAVNNDGHHKIGYTAPSGRGQTDVITTAMVYADVRSDTIGYVEAHGTGTPLGDPIEIEALTRAFGGSPKRGTCAIGSVKSNFGHLVEASGIAGLIKAVATLEHGEIPPTLHYTEPNPQIDFASTPFFVADRVTPWRMDGPRRASVSSFGIGGTNAHAVLEAWEPHDVSMTAGRLEILTLSAESAESLAQMRTALAEWLMIHIEAPLGNVAFTLNTGRQAFRHRWACVTTTKHELLRALGPAEGHSHARAAWSVGNTAELPSPRTRFRPKLPIDLAALQELATRWTRGERIDFRSLYETRNVRRIPLPTYPFQRKRFWLDPPSQMVGPRGFGPWLGQVALAAAAPESGKKSELLLLAGETAEQLRRRVSACRSLAASADGPSLGALCQVASSQASGEHRIAALASSRDELASLLGAHLHGNEDARLLRSASARRPAEPRLAFVFSGTGGQWWGMGRDLLREEPVFRDTLKECAEILDPWTDTPFMTIWNAPEATSRMGEIDIAQPAIFALQVGLAKLWRSWGVVPDSVVGHSMGEVSAAHIAGALSLEDALAVIHHRSRLMKRLAGKGRTASVELPMEAAQRAIAGFEDRLSVAGSNAPTASVISGAPEALEEVLKLLRSKRVFCRELRVDVAAHSPQMDALVPELEAALAGVTASNAAVPIYSTVLARRVSGRELDAQYWCRNLREPFRFAAAVEHLVDDGYRRFLELSPHPVLANSIEQTLEYLEREGAVIPSLHRNWPDLDVMLRSLGTLYTMGHEVTWPPLEEEKPTRDSAILQAVEHELTTADRVRALVAEVLLLDTTDIATDVPLVNIGMDSVTGLSLIGKLKTRFGVRLDTNELLLLGTIERIARRLEGGADESVVYAVRIPIRTSPEPALDLVMFPGAGGTALMLAPWTTPNLIDGASISAMHPPGHGSDRRKPIRRMGELLELYLKTLVPAERPLVLVGYSLGGLVTYAVAHALERMGMGPRAVIISHTLPPPIWRERMFSRDTHFDEIFGRLYESWGIDSGSRAFFLESARADFEIAESFDPPEEKLAALTCIISGSGDHLAPAREMHRWDALCTKTVHFSAKGGHWDFIDDPSNRELLSRVYARACALPDAWLGRDLRIAEGAELSRVGKPS
ncbi:MAG TPA: acyltransferase domain-containing protein [Kofleriaceae bacterium]|nr:acyltransferase domain-containing protein [Kofleriaceae bacterium]